MWLSDLSIKRPVFIIMIMLALVVVGVLAYSRMTVDLFPDVSTPVITIRTRYSGAGPEIVEKEITKPIENAVSPLSGVKSLSSTSDSGLSVVRVEYELEYPVDKAANEVRERLSWVQRFLPRDADDPIMFRFDPSMAPILMFSLSDKTGTMKPIELRRFVENSVKPRVERAKGVASVDIRGGLEREIRVLLSLSRLQALGLSSQQVSRAISLENADIPGGLLTDTDMELTLRTPLSFKRPEEVAEVVVANKGGIPIRVKHVATVEDTFKEQRTYTRLDGNSSVVIMIRKQSGTNTVQVAERANEVIDEILKEKPNLIAIKTRDESQFIKAANEHTIRDLILGGLLACLVVFLFFRNWRMTLITVIGLPVIVVGTFWAISLLGFSLNMITLLALSLCIGLLIDDAIVVRENMFRHLEAGENARVAASRGTAEIVLAVLAMTLSIVSVFLPVAFATGMIGKIFREFGITVSVAVLISLFEAFTLAPMLAAHFDPRVGGKRRKQVALDNGKATQGESSLAVSGTDSHAFSWALAQRFLHGARRSVSSWSRMYDALTGSYRRILFWALGHRAVTLLIVAVIFVLSSFMVMSIGRSFFPEIAQDYFEIAISQPPGTTLEKADGVVREAERRIARETEVAHVLARVGSISSGPEESSISVRLKERGKVREVQRRLRRSLAKIEPGTTIRFSGQAATITGGLVGAASVRRRPVQLAIRGDVPLSELERAAQQVKEVVANVPGITDPDVSLKPPRPGYSVTVDRARAEDRGLSASAIGNTVRSLVSGEVATIFRDGNDDIDIVVRLQEQDRRKTQDIMSLPMVSPKGSIVQLSSVSQLMPSNESSEISRFDRERQFRVGANFSGRAQGAVMSDIEKGLQEMILPPGVTVKFTGQSQEMGESFKSLYFVMTLSIIFMYMVLASQLGSFAQPLIIMMALPLSVAGAIGALLLTGKYLDIPAIIGMILLMGIVAKNSILLLDFANVRRRQGIEPKQAMLEAGQIRLRPVIMTSAALIFGMLPVAIGIGAGSEFRSPMAITVIGGVITSTLLTLVVVPVIYSLVEGLKKQPVTVEQAPPGEDEED